MAAIVPHGDVRFKGRTLDAAFEADVVIENTLGVKSVATITAQHEAQRRTYLRMSGLSVGLLLNFHEVRLIDRLRRFVH